MPTMAEMLAAKQAKPESQSPSPLPSKEPSGESAAGAVGDDSDGSGVKDDPVLVGDGADESERVSQPATAVDVGEGAASIASKPPAPIGLRLNTLKLGIPSLNRGTPAVTGPLPEDAAPVIPGVDDRPGESRGESGSATPEADVPAASLSLIGIAGLGSDGTIGIELADIDPEEDGAVPLDHIPVTAPDRKLPPELDKQQASFIKSLDSIYTLHKDPDMFVDMVRKIMSDMQDNADLVKLLADQDSHTMIIGLRQQAGMASVKKSAAKEKRGTGGARSAGKASSAMDSVAESLAAFAGIG